ncbi:MAG: hypothetical protein PVJ64_02495 [Gemmatimonadales bacterium]|jgi:hypothetical protein
MSVLALEGAVGGLLGAAALAVWFFITDTIAGQSFHTPALLGARLFGGPASASGSTAGLVAGYTLFHGLAFVAAGLMVAWAVALFERTPPLLIPGTFFLVVFFEFVYYTYVLAFVEPVLGQVNWPAVLVGNLLAAAAMIAYFWRRHPDLLGRLAHG